MIVDEEIEKPVFYASSSLSTAERNYPNLHIEALVVVYAIKKFHKYVYGNKFTVYTDHRPLTSIFGKNSKMSSLIAARLQRFVYMVSMYDFEIKNREGKKMLKEDCLSRLPLKGITEIEVAEEICIKKIRDEFPIDFHRVEIETQNDELMSKLFRTIIFGFPEQLLDDLLKNFYKHQDKLSVHGSCKDLKFSGSIFLFRRIYSLLRTSVNVSNVTNLPPGDDMKGQSDL